MQATIVGRVAPPDERQRTSQSPSAHSREAQGDTSQLLAVGWGAARRYDDLISVNVAVAQEV